MKTLAKEKKNLLLIEKNEHRSDELCSLLADRYNIIEKNNVRDGMAFLLEHKDSISAVLLNGSHFPEESKWFLDEIHGNIRLDMIPVLLIAEENETSEEPEMLRKCAVDCIHKPFHREAIFKRIQNAIQLRDSMPFSEMEKMLKELPSNIYLKDADGRYIFATQYWHHLEHKDDPGWTIRGKTDVEIRKDRENALMAMKADMEVIESGKGTSYTIEINEDGIQEFLEIIKRPLLNENGNVTGIIGLINHVTEYELMKRKLEELVRTDELTGLYSRHYFEEYVLELRKKERYPISMISADCDGLKKINDTYGHLVGDEYIRMASLLFRMVLPEDSAVFRTGGDEFIILLPETPEENARCYMEKMKQKENMFQIRGKKLSVSFGMSCMKTSTDLVDECIATSDMNMYQEKRNKTLKRDT